VVPLLQIGAVGLYPVWGTWFPSHLSLEGIGLYPDLLGRNRWPIVPGVQDPDSWGHSLDRRQNTYSYVTTGTVAGFNGEAMELEPP
jgi:hypothetical protein